MTCPRSNKHKVWMSVAHEIAAMGTCQRRQVGAVLVLDGELVASGYNGAPRGEDHCTEAGCEMEHGHCVRSVHAELNALLQAGRRGRATAGATLYTTASPCRACMGALLNCGITRIFYAQKYADPSHAGDRAAWALEAAKRHGIEMTYLPLEREAACGPGIV